MCSLRFVSDQMVFHSMTKTIRYIQQLLYNTHNIIIRLCFSVYLTADLIYICVCVCRSSKYVKQRVWAISLGFVHSELTNQKKHSRNTKDSVKPQKSNTYSQHTQCAVSPTVKWQKKNQQRRKKNTTAAQQLKEERCGKYRKPLTSIDSVSTHKAGTWLTQQST